jgi:hypothetical protein
VKLPSGILAAVLAAVPCAAPAADETLGTFRQWSAMRFGSGEALTCMAFSQPVKSEGEYTRRGDAFVFVTRRPGDDDAASVTLEAGYPYAPDSSASVVVGDLEVSLRTEGSTAWLDQDAARLIAAMRTGREMVVRGRSKRGTETVDRYSLYGFTAAYKAARRACRGR